MKLKQSDWDILLPVKKYTLGETDLNLKPLQIDELAPVVKEFREILKLIKDIGITSENYRARIVDIIELVVKTAPSVLSTLSGLDVSDTKRLPASIAIDLMTRCIEVNIESQQDFLKNLMALAEKTAEMTSTVQVLEN